MVGSTIMEFSSTKRACNLSDTFMGGVGIETVSGNKVLA